MKRMEQYRVSRKERDERDFKIREKLAGYFFDISKLVFAGMVLVGGVSLIMDGPQLKRVILSVLGVAFAALLANLGYRIIKN